MNYIVKEFELALLSDKVRKSPAKLDEYLSDEFYEFTQSGQLFTKKDIIDCLPNLPEEIFIVENYSEKVLAEDIIHVTYFTERKIPSTWEKKFTICSSIWKKYNSKWQMIFFQWTPWKKQLN